MHFKLTEVEAFLLCKINANLKKLQSINLQLKYVIIISSSSKQLEIMIVEYSLLFQVLLFGKLFSVRDKNRFYIDEIIFLRMKPGKETFFKCF